MQPCSQPWYGLAEYIMPTSGLVTLLTRVLLSSKMYSVFRGSLSQSSTASGIHCTYSPFRNLFLGLNCAPRPLSNRSFASWLIIELLLDYCWTVVTFSFYRFVFTHLLLQVSTCSVCFRLRISP